MLNDAVMIDLLPDPYGASSFMSLTDFPALLDRIEQGTASSKDVSVLQRLTEAAPAHVTAHVALARACEQVDRWAEARRSWQHAYLLQPGSPAVRAGLQRTAHRTAPEPRGEAAGGQAAGPPTQRDEETAAPPAPESPSRQEPASPQEIPSPLARSVSAGSARSGGEQAAGEGAALEELTSSLPEQPDEDLDSLIEELEGARIEPTPNPEDVPAPDLDADGDDMVSPTLARIYEAQGQYAEAARVHRRLAEERPAEAEEHRRQAAELEARAQEEREERSG